MMRTKSLDDWKANAERGTSGDMVWDILSDWTSADEKAHAELAAAQRTIKELTANRACAWAELDEIRAALNADEDESTVDKVHRLVSTIESRAARIEHGLTIVTTGANDRD
jgi:DNA repair exonuclease SbcCD ATPase subunit